jgi:hypothetical protein
MASTVVLANTSQLSVGADGDIIVVAPGITIGNSGSEALINSRAGVILLNYGGILSARSLSE